MVISHFASFFRFCHHLLYFMTDHLFHLYGRKKFMKKWGKFDVFLQIDEQFAQKPFLRR